MMQTELNFPSFQHKFKEEKGLEHIWDPLRNVWLVLTPEEWVRQNLVRYFADILVYPAGLMQTECQILVGKVKKRFDLVVMDKNLDPWLICECKAPGIPIDNRTTQQAAVYNSTLKCPYLAVTNGLHHYCFAIDFANGNFTPLKDFPEYPAS